MSAVADDISTGWWLRASDATSEPHDGQSLHGSRMEPGTLYGALSRLERQGWIEPLPPEERRRPYRLTVVGAAVLRRHLASLKEVVITGLHRLEAE